MRKPEDNDSKRDPNTGAGHNPDKDGEFDGRTYVYIRTHPSDDGTEPLAPGLPFWISPDILVTPPGGSPGNEAKAGEINDLTVTVSNKGGLTCHNAWLEVFFADPSTAFTPANTTLIASGSVTIPGYNVVPVTFPWTPQPSEAGHKCLLARVQAPLTGEIILNPGIFDVIGDRHVAQKNIHVVAMADAVKSGFKFKMTNPLRERSTFALKATPVRPTAATTNALRGALCRFAQPGATLVGVKLAGPSATTVVEPNAAIDCTLTFTKPTDTVRAGDVHLVEVTQTDPKSKKVVGGLWVVLVA